MSDANAALAAGRRTRLWLPILAAGAALAVSASAPSQGAAPRKPNVLVIVADDLGYSDIGAFGGEIATPNLDALARRGLRLTGFHTAPTCSPTRAMLLTGADNHETGLGSMGEMIAAVPAGLRAQMQARPGYEGYLNTRAASLADRLDRAGYLTVMAGKWHLGLTPDTSPKARGFQRSFAMLQGGHDHFGDDQTAAYSAAGAAATYRDDGRLTQYPVGRYSADVFTDRMIGYLREAKAARRPFFAYMAYTEPHWPLQAPDDVIDKYKGRYEDGPEALRDRRLARMKALGLIAADVGAHEMVGTKPWSSLTLPQRAIQSRKMEVYAAMVDRMDQNIGRLIATLKATGQYDNTVIVFMSDNGAEGQEISGPMGRAGFLDAAKMGVDNTPANMGRRRSYISYGPAWAQAATAPSRLYKGNVTEGGILTPAIVAGPGVRPGRSNALVDVLDITPTVLALTGTPAADTPSGLPLRGKSWVPLLAGQAAAVRGPEDRVGRELFFGRAMRQGDWKAVSQPAVSYQPGAPVEAAWQLYDVKTDPGETHDLAAAFPGRLKALVEAWDRYAAETGVFVPSPPPAAKGG